jgi:phage recombination protein Bet
MNAVATIEPANGLSIIGSMAQQYGMDKRAFEATLRATVMPQNASNEQAAAFLLVAKEHHLNPFTREIFAFPTQGGGIQPVVSVDGWMKLINSHPDFDGMDFVDHLDNGTLMSITCRMYRKGRAHPVEVTEYMSECKRETPTWKRWPARMLRHKSAIQASRYAFGFAGILEPDEAERVVVAQADATPEVVLFDARKARHDEAVEQYQESLIVIRKAIAEWDTDNENTDALYTVAETWAGIPQAAQVDLWLAPSKGGYFTTHERDVIKTKLPKEAKQ